MKAIRYYAYGSPDVLQLQDVDVPAVKDGDILIRVRAASVNPLDWHFMRGMPYVMRLQGGLSRPKVNGLGIDLAGHVEAVGKNVTTFQPGDEVFGVHLGGETFAEYACVPHDAAVLRKPADLTFEQAASVPASAITALQALRTKGKIQSGHKVLINGAAGGVGTFAVQIAKAYGAEVTGVCSSRNVEMVRSIGADQVIDYTKEDFTDSGQRYDLILDNAGNRTLSDRRRALTPTGTLVLNSGSGGRWIGGLSNGVKALALSPLMRQRLVFFIALPDEDDLPTLHELLKAGKITPVIDRTYPLSEVPEAIGYLEKGHAPAKVVITI